MRYAMRDIGWHDARVHIEGTRTEWRRMFAMMRSICGTNLSVKCVGRYWWEWTNAGCLPAAVTGLFL
jgi:hypothetical protein